MAPRQPAPTVAPAYTQLPLRPVPPPPPGLNPEETTSWQKLHNFRNQIDAIRAHLQPPGTRTAHLNTLTWLYFNQRVAGRHNGGFTTGPYRNERTLFSRYSKDRRAEDNLHLATVGFLPVRTEDLQLWFWNWYLDMNQLPEVDAVGTGLPNALRLRDGHERTAAAVLLTLGAPAAGEDDEGEEEGGEEEGEEEEGGEEEGGEEEGGEEEGEEGGGEEERGEEEGEEEEGEEEEEDEGIEEEEENKEGDDGQPPTKRRRFNDDDDGEDGREGALEEERSKDKGKGKQRAADW